MKQARSVVSANHNRFTGNLIAAAFDHLLSAERLAGKMGERIAAGNAAFRGRAEQLRRDYIAFVLKETDLGIHACEYGWCVFQAETARRGGRLAPDPVGRSPAVCLDCANIVVEPKHAPYWREPANRGGPSRLEIAGVGAPLGNVRRDHASLQPIVSESETDKVNRLPGLTERNLAETALAGVCPLLSVTSAERARFVLVGPGNSDARSTCPFRGG